MGYIQDKAASRKVIELFMKRFTAFLLILMLFVIATVASAGTVDNYKACKQCGMDRTVFPQSRMLIIYADGTTVAVCSLHCASSELKQNKGNPIKSLMVADYTTGELIDARTAIWVVGGRKDGIMTSVAKWAFATEMDAQTFVKEYGGKVTKFDEAMRAANEETVEGTKTVHAGHGHAGHDMGPGSQMLFNPAFGDDIYHAHPAGMWMVNYKFMHMNMSGLRDGTTNVDKSSVGFNRPTQYSYMMIPTSMTMDMHMLMLMYGITDQLTIMTMANYQSNRMNMLMDMGPMKPIAQEDPMTTRGFGDIELRGIYKINKHLTGSLGLSLPTGSIRETITMMRKEYRAPYDMQLGSGSYDLKPALTYNVLSDDAKWNWGAQAMYTWHTAKNSNDWSFGDSLRLNSWIQRAFGPAASWMRFAYTDAGRIKGKDSEIEKLIHPVTGMSVPAPDADPLNYGGQRLDGAIGVSYQQGAFSIGVEGGVPIYQNLNGLQLKTTWFLNAGMQLMF